MSLTNDAGRMLDWAKKEANTEYTDKVFSKFNDTTESYYEKRTEDAELVYEFDWDSFKDVKEQIEALWQEESVMKDAALISVVSTMKNKPVKAEEKDTKAERQNGGGTNGDVELPSYVYVF